MQERFCRKFCKLMGKIPVSVNICFSCFLGGCDCLLSVNPHSWSWIPGKMGRAAMGDTHSLICHRDPSHLPEQPFPFRQFRISFPSVTPLFRCAVQCLSTGYPPNA